MSKEQGSIQPYNYDDVLPSGSGPCLVLTDRRRRPQRASHQPLKRL